jgi:5-methylcytosine-specific restriction endonuclease McrA
MIGDDISNINPGEQLRQFLKALYPLDSPENSDEYTRTFIFRIDESFMADGAFARLVYESSINYLVRRWINTAQYLYKKLQKEYSNDREYPLRFIKELRKFIRDNTNLKSNDAEKLLVLLQDCLKVRNQKKRSKSKQLLKGRILKKALEQNNNELRCYICGRVLREQEDDLTFKENKNESNKLEIEVEHIWPKTMGGATQDFNLKISCNQCNRMKQNYLDSNDFHYEKMSFSFLENKIEKIDKIALWSKSQYSCSVCKKPASSVGTLNLGRINLNDSWHFLNIEAYCDEHMPE